MSAYFLGFLGGSRLAPEMIRRVGHVRVFSALGSMISAVLILYPLLLDWQAWAVMRVLIGFCFSGIYVTAESWLNNTASNETRGQALSAYMIVQMLGIIAVAGPAGDGRSQRLWAVHHPVGAGVAGLHADPAGRHAGADLRHHQADELSRNCSAPRRLGCAGMLLTGGVFAAMFGMASV